MQNAKRGIVYHWASKPHVYGSAPPGAFVKFEVTDHRRTSKPKSKVSVEKWRNWDYLLWYTEGRVQPSAPYFLRPEKSFFVSEDYIADESDVGAVFIDRVPMDEHELEAWPSGVMDALDLRAGEIVLIYGKLLPYKRIEGVPAAFVVTLSVTI